MTPVSALIVLLVLLALVSCGGSTAEASGPPETGAVPAPDAGAPTTTRIDAGDPGDTSAPLHDAIVRGLQTDELVLTCKTGVAAGTSRFRPEWVGVHRVDLDGDGRRDWVVNGRHDCLRLPEAAYWWVYQAAPEGPRQVLRAELGAALDVLPSSHHGWRDLRFHLVSGRGTPLVAHSQYDGRRYVAAPE